MKKYFLTAAALLLLSPLTASADQIGTGYLKIGASIPDAYKTRADYDILNYTYQTGTKIEFDIYEAFCISSDPIYNNETALYGFYSVSEKLPSASINFLTWVANWATTSQSFGSISDADTIKSIGQGVIWDTLDVFFGVYTHTAAVTALYAADIKNQGAYVNQWLVAVNPTTGSVGSVGSRQDYLVQAAPVPEPGTMLLFGTGLAGLAAVSRRRRS